MLLNVGKPHFLKDVINSERRTPYGRLVALNGIWSKIQFRDWCTVGICGSVRKPADKKSFQTDLSSFDNAIDWERQLIAPNPSKHNTMASLRTTSASCLGCVARRPFLAAAGGRPTAVANAFVAIQTRGKKTKRRDQGVVVRLLEDVTQFGRRETILRVERGRMRNFWYPNGMAEYMTSARMVELGVSAADAIAQPDPWFVAQEDGVEAEAEAEAEIEAKPARPTMALKTLSVRPLFVAISFFLFFLCTHQTDSGVCRPPALLFSSKPSSHRASYFTGNPFRPTRPPSSARFRLTMSPILCARFSRAASTRRPRWSAWSRAMFASLSPWTRRVLSQHSATKGRTNMRRRLTVSRHWVAGRSTLLRAEVTATPSPQGEPTLQRRRRRLAKTWCRYGRLWRWWLRKSRGKEIVKSRLMSLHVYYCCSYTRSQNKHWKHIAPKTWND